MFNFGIDRCSGRGGEVNDASRSPELKKVESSIGARQSIKAVKITLLVIAIIAILATPSMLVIPGLGPLIPVWIAPLVAIPIALYLIKVIIDPA